MLAIILNSKPEDVSLASELQDIQLIKSALFATQYLFDLIRLPLVMNILQIRMFDNEIHQKPLVILRCCQRKLHSSILKVYKFLVLSMKD